MKLQLPNVTLVAVSDINISEHFEALQKSCEGIQWGAVLLLTPTLGSIDAWNKYIIYELPNYVSTDFALLIHADGYVIRPDLWRNDFLSYDYVGAPFPLPTDDYSYRDSTGALVRVGNSVSLRSKKLMDLVATRPMEYHYGNNNEDGQICCWERNWLEEQGCKFAPLEVAVHFSKEHEIAENVGIETFAFHTLG